MDRKVDPCQNFYQFSCGGWKRDFKLPGDKAFYWRQGNVLSDHVEEQLNSLLADLAAKKSPSANDRKLSDFYKSCMEVQAPDTGGIETLKMRLKKLDDLKERATVAKRLAEQDLMGAGGLFEFFSDQDLKNSSQMIAFVDRGGMGLPDPDYYLKDDTKSKEIRTRYVEHIARTLQMFGETAKKSIEIGQHILAFETELAKHALKKDDRRDVEKRFHPMSYAELKALVPAFDWDSFISTLGIKAPEKLNVVEPEFMRHLNQALSTLKAEELSYLLKYKLIHSSAYFLAGPPQREDFGFWLAYLHGQKELPPRWKYCTQIIAGNMSEALGQAYVNSIKNSGLIRKKTGAMFADFKAAFAADLKSLSWMDETTRSAAKRKLNKLGNKIGWPVKWRDYAKLEIGNQFFGNELNTNEYETRRNLAKMGKPTDRSEWQMSVWEPNAYYSDSNNEMVLPLGETVPPVFDPRFSDGANYASLGGSTIGHELTHGFDDAGKDMDAEGNFTTWWSAKSKEGFESQAACFVRQTEAYDIIPGSRLRIRGKATLGENLADNGGIKLGLMALKKLQKQPGHKVPKFVEFNELQQYFLAYGQGWCSAETSEHLRNGLLTDYHPPTEFRVNAVLSNQAEFAEAFQCKPGTPMAPKERCSLW